MKQYVKLFENWKREEEIVLTKGRLTITISVVNGRIESIYNPDRVPVPFFEGQPVTVFMKDWACDRGYRWNGEDPCDPGEKKVFGVKTKHIPKGDILRRIYPSKFRD